jgi:osmoprotectant transport system permease protein
MMPTLFEVWTSSTFWEEAWQFVSLTFQGLGIAVLLGIPLGIWLTRLPRIADPVTNLLALLQTFPSLALLGLLIPLMHLKPSTYVFLAVAYSLFPIVLNTHVGITQVSPAVRDAARGMGMTGTQVLWSVDLPLAFPVILAGVRTAAVVSIGIITICAFAGAGSLGLYILRGMTRSNNELILTGVIPILVLTLLVFWGLGGIGWLTRKNARLGLVAGGGVITVITIYALGALAGPPLWRLVGPTAKPTLHLASKNFVEGEILTEILKQMLEAHTDLQIEVKANLSPDLIYKDILAGEIDLYPEYTGNLLTAPDALNRAVPKDKSTITTLVREGMRRQFGLVLLEPFGLNNTYVLCVRRDVAKRFGLKKISDLRRVSHLRTMVDLDFLDRPDGWDGLVRTYGLRLPKPGQASPDQRYKAIEAEDVDMVAGYATDWQITALDLVALEDDKSYFPNYHGAPLARAEVLERHPEIARILNRLKGRIDDRTMSRLNFEVARKKRSVEDVAHEFLSRRGLLDRQAK